MWVELICGSVLYRLVRRFLFDDDDLFAVGALLFSVAHRLEQLYGGKAYVGLRIPDTDTASRQNIDLVLVTKREAVVVSVKNISGFVSVDVDGSWVCTGGAKHKTERHQDPVAETKRQVVILESYLEQRGVALPQGYLSYKVICPHPDFRTIDPNCFPSEVITHEQWMQLKPEPKGMFSGWIKVFFRGAKKEMQESIQENIAFILSTAPMWDRLELKGNKYLLGDFLEFKGKHDDIQALRKIKRSKVGRLAIQKTSMFGLEREGGGWSGRWGLLVMLLSAVGFKFSFSCFFIPKKVAFGAKLPIEPNAAHSELQVLYSPRDYRSEGASASESKEVTVRSSTEVLFQPQDCSKIQKFKLSSIISMLLTA